MTNFIEQNYGYDFETGKPRIGTLADGIQVWSICQEIGNSSVSAAAKAFNISKRLVEEACEFHDYLYVSKGQIEHDGVDE
ncbi:hypothetical protein [Dyadobacter bucti]|uniref:hypothetical protein n=1 Tax=Dyadobacter bucti TaxID=2572203 RepID=UPI001108D6C6|nr:hypothetical protein [Dyadobacter bucti]